MNISRRTKLTVIIASVMILSACGDSSEKNSYRQKAQPSKSKTSPSSKKLSNQPLSIRWTTGEQRIPDGVRLSDPSTSRSFIDGKMVKNDTISLKEYLAEHGKIEFRKGKDFFPDWSIEINAKSLKPESTIQLSTQSATLQIKPAGEKLPKTSFLNNVKGVVKTGRLSELGMPIQVDFSTSNSKNGIYHVQGKAFATIGDIRIKNGALDATYDSFRTMDLIAKDFIKANTSLPYLKKRHTQYSSDKNKKGKDEGVEGLMVYSHKDAQNQQKLIRVQLLKHAQGWKAEKTLKPWELQYSRQENSKRESDQMKVATSKKVEKFLKSKKINNHIDSNIRCNKTKVIGLCTANITVLENNEKTCTRKAYTFKKGAKWNFDKEVSPDLKIDYKTKKLVKDKRKAKNLKEYILNKSIGLMFGKCSMF